jgi:hypothetical protein
MFNKKDLPGIGPRHTCLSYMVRCDAYNPIVLTRREFNHQFESNNFSDGPWQDCFGRDYGEPLNIFRQAFGKLNDGSYVYCETNGIMDKEIKSFYNNNVQKLLIFYHLLNSTESNTESNK